MADFALHQLPLNAPLRVLRSAYSSLDCEGKLFFLWLVVMFTGFLSLLSSHGKRDIEIAQST